MSIDNDNKKPTAKDVVMQSRKELVDKMIEMMKGGEIPWHRGWDKLSPHNATTGKSYHGVNQIRLALESIFRNLEDPRFMTFQQAKDQGYKIKPGAESIVLEKWVWEKQVILKDDNGEPVLDKDGNEQKIWAKLEHPYVNYFRVFNAQDIDGIPPLLRHEHDPKSVESKMIEDIKESSRCPIEEKLQDRAFYRVSEDKIILPPQSAFKSQNEFIATLLHEMSHSTGHESCMNRPLVNMYGTPEYAKEELRAELGSVFTQASLGINLTEENIANHSSYLQSWISVLEENYNEFFFAVQDADKISQFLTDNYEQVVERDLQQEISKDLGIDDVSKLKQSWIATLNSITDPDIYSQISHISSKIGYGFSNADLKALADIFRDGDHQKSIMYLLEDCNYHQENKWLEKGEFEKFGLEKQEGLYPMDPEMEKTVEVMEKDRDSLGQFYDFVGHSLYETPLYDENGLSIVDKGEEIVILNNSDKDVVIAFPTGEVLSVAAEERELHVLSANPLAKETIDSFRNKDFSVTEHGNEENIRHMNKNPDISIA